MAWLRVSVAACNVNCPMAGDQAQLHSGQSRLAARFTPLRQFGCNRRIAAGARLCALPAFCHTPRPIRRRNAGFIAMTSRKGKRVHKRPARVAQLRASHVRSLTAQTRKAPVMRELAPLLLEIDQLRRELAQARERTQSLKKLVDEDPLMPIANRRAFVRELTRMMAFAQRYGVASSIIYFDVNNMKQVNDSWGHAAGDAALVAISKILIDNVRTTDVVGRLG